jgi:hypothetical protein
LLGPVRVLLFVRDLLSACAWRAVTEIKLEPTPKAAPGEAAAASKCSC